MIKRAVIAIVLSTAAVSASAQTSLSDLVSLSVIDGGRNSDGSYVAALRMTLKDGWKTYWRSPGDAGIPPSFSWSGSRNVGEVAMTWPAPVVFEQDGLRTIGYRDQLILPLTVTPGRPGQPVRVQGEMDFGVCKDVCVPARLSFSHVLDPEAHRNPAIAAALAQRPFSASEAGVRGTTCAIAPSGNGLSLEARIDMPRTGDHEIVVVESGNPSIWTSEMSSRRQDRVLTAKGELVHNEGRAFALDRSAIRITVLGRGQAVEITGCEPG